MLNDSAEFSIFYRNQLTLYSPQLAVFNCSKELFSLAKRRGPLESAKTTLNSKGLLEWKEQQKFRLKENLEWERRPKATERKKERAFRL